MITDNLQQSTTILRDQVQRVDATVKDAVDRGRLQIIRADELLTRTLDRVEQTSDMVHSTVISPIRQLSGIMQGITVGLEFFFGGRGGEMVAVAKSGVRFRRMRCSSRLRLSRVLAFFSPQVRHTHAAFTVLFPSW